MGKLLLCLLLVASCGFIQAQFGEDAPCPVHVPEGLYVPSVCFMYEFIGTCEEKGYNAFNLDQYYECLSEEVLTEEEMEVVDDMWYQDFGPGSEHTKEVCAELNFEMDDEHNLNHYAACLEHYFGLNYTTYNQAFLEVEVSGGVAEIDWEDYYGEEDPSVAQGPELPKDPVQRFSLIMHGMALAHLPGYNRCDRDHWTGEQEFMCGDEHCIPAGWECDDFVDCEDKSDELFCGGGYGDDYWDDYNWEDPWYTCAEVEDDEWCDGHWDCEWDEQYCGKFSWSSYPWIYPWSSNYPWSFPWSSNYPWGFPWSSSFPWSFPWSSNFPSSFSWPSSWSSSIPWNYPWSSSSISSY